MKFHYKKLILHLLIQKKNGITKIMISIFILLFKKINKEIINKIKMNKSLEKIKEAFA